MFTIDSEARVTPYSGSEAAAEDDGVQVHNRLDLDCVISGKPGEWAVMLWNQLPGVTPIHTPPGEPAAKFRNKQTAVERIWKKLCEIYPAAVVQRATIEDVPKETKLARAIKGAKSVSPEKVAPRKNSTFKAPGNGAGRKSAWAEELTEELRKRFKPGEDFELADVYKLIPAFQRRHKENHHIAARLRTTLAQDLRGNGIVKSVGSGRGKYRMLAAK
jgi:hypothetical protein